MIKKNTIFVEISLLLIFGILFTVNKVYAIPPFGLEGHGFEFEVVESSSDLLVESVKLKVDEVVDNTIESGLKGYIEEKDLETVLSYQQKTLELVDEKALVISSLVEGGEYYGELKRLNLDAETVVKGYTVEVSDEFKVGMTSGSVIVPVEVVVKRINPAHIPVEMTQEKMSDIYEFDVRHEVGEGKTESLGVLEKNIHVAIKFDLKTLNKKIIRFWNKPEQRWVPLKSRSDFYDGYVRATINLPYARLALFDKPDVYEGWASWYRQFEGHYAATTIFPRKTMLKVTNISGSPRDGKTVELKVNDYGPDPTVFTSLDPLDTLHAKRVIDLNDHTYLHIGASLGSGIMPVRVEVIN